MTKITHHLGCKVFAIFVAVICGVTGVISLTALIFAGEQGLFTSQAPNYYESSWCQNITRNDARNVVDGYLYAPQNLEMEYQESTSNFGYEIFNEKGQSVAKGNIPKVAGYTETRTVQIHLDGQENPVLYEVKAYVAEPLVAMDPYYMSAGIYENISDIGLGLLPIVTVSGLLFVLFMIYLLCAAGHRGKTYEIYPNLQDRIPLEIYFALIFTLGSVPMAMGVGSVYNNTNGLSVLNLTSTIGCLVLLCILVIAVAMTMATRLKLGKWWRNSLTYWCFHIFWKVFLAVVTTFKDAVVALPLTWKVVATWFVFSGFYLSSAYNVGGIILLNTIILVLLIGISAQLQKLRKAGDYLANGNLDYKVDTKGMFRTFARHGSNLNSLSKGASIAMEQKMKSERLKTELITNVSHDIKTPLTSIINYVDLLKKEALSGQALDYLEVLDRQSRRLKKLTEDLVEASKASTGNIAANLNPTDLCELVSQAVAEYEGKLEGARLEVVVASSHEEIYGLVDGNLMWRVLSNLLSNACKYAQPDTRVYIDLSKDETMATITMKNISRDKLNVDPDELMERFVRGDSSRTTEGSGLGLNIARSLIDLQKGKFDLSIDGDLFKAFVSCPLASMPKPPVAEPPVAVETVTTEEESVSDFVVAEKDASE